LFLITSNKAEAAFGVDLQIKQVKTANSGVVYYLDHARGKKKTYPNAASFLAYGNKWSDIVTISQAELDKWPEINLARTKEDSTVYYIKDGKKTPIRSAADFVSFGFDWQDVVMIRDKDLENYNLADYSQVGLNTVAVRLALSLDATNPKADVAPFGAKDVKIAVFNFKAHGQDVAIKKITVAFKGVFNINGLDKVRLTDGERYFDITSSNNRKMTFNFDSSPLRISVNSEKKISILVNFKNYSGSTNHEIRAAIEQASDIEADTNAAGNFPVSGNAFKIIDAGDILGKVKIQEKSITTNTYSKAIIGNTKQVIARFNVSETTGKESILVRKLVIKNFGTIDTNTLKNFILTDGNGKIVSQATLMGPDSKVVFNIKDYKIGKKGNIDFVVLADIVYGEGRNINFDMNDADVVGGDYGYSSATTFANINEKISIGREALTAKILDLKNNGKVFKNKNGALFGVFEITGVGKRVALSSISFALIKSSSAPALDDDVFLVNYATGEILGTLNASAFGSEAASFNVGTFIDARKKLSIALVGEFPDTSKEGNNYAFSLNKIEYKTDNSASFIDTLNIKGKNVAVKKSSLSIYKNTAMTPTNFIKGQKGVCIASFIIAAGSGDDTMLNGLTFFNSLNGSSISSDDSVGNVRLVVGAGKAVPYLGSIGNSLVFENLNQKVSAGKNVEVKVLADIDPNSNTSEAQLKLTDVDARNYATYAMTNITGLGAVSNKVTFGVSGFSLANLSGGSIKVGSSSNALASFSLSNSGEEDIALKNMNISTTGNGISNLAGFSNLKVVATYGTTQKTLSTLSKPTGGLCNISLGQFVLTKAMGAVVFKLSIDANANAAIDHFEIGISNIDAQGKFSGLAVSPANVPTSNVEVTVQQKDEKIISL